MDDRAELEGLLASLRKPQSGKRLLQVLVALRKEVNAPDHHTKIQTLRQHNCLKPLVAYTQYDQNLKAVDLALSILGNCCTNAGVCRQTVNEFNILHNLHRVLEKHQKDSIKGRVFRILGNLCDGVEVLTIVKKEPDVVKYVLTLLKTFELNDNCQKLDSDDSDKAVTVPTVTMAMRFIRKLISKNTFNLLADEQNLIEAIGVLLIKCSKSYLENQKNDVLINDVLKILQILSSSVFNNRDIIAELRNTAEGNALEAFGDIILLNPERIIKIILKLASVSKNQSDLPIEVILMHLIKSAREYALNDNPLCRNRLECIHKLMDHIGFHDKLNNNVEELIKLFNDLTLKDDYSTQCCIYICSILNKSRYNENLIKSQLNGNIILTIIEKLQKVTGKSCNRINIDVHDVKDFEEPYYKNSKRFKSTLSEIDAFMDKQYDSNNDRCVSPSSCSDVSSTGPFSPTASNHIICHDSDSDNYSPLCSENEWEEETRMTTPEDNAIDSEREDKHQSFNQDQIESRYRLREEMIALLKYYCTIKPMHPHLGDPRLITVLLNLVLTSAQNRSKCDAAFSLVLSIVQTRDFLIPFMISEVITQLNEVVLNSHNNCQSCENLQNKAEDVISKILLVGQNESIKGDIAYLLLGKSQDEIKDKLVLSIPYVIRNNSVLNKLLIKCGGLKTLIKLLKTGNVSVQEKTIKAICTLATDSLKIKNPVDKKLNGSLRRVRIGFYEFPDQCNNIVTFKLDDGFTVKADRDYLNKKSDYFSTLLSGNFVESEQTEITLKNVTGPALKCLLQMLTLNVKLKTALAFDYDLETILEVVSLSDRFLLTELNYVLVCHIEQLITASTVPKFYKWAIESGTNIMRIESVAFVLVGDISYKEKIELFRKLFKLGYFLALVDDIEKLITQFL